MATFEASATGRGFDTFASGPFGFLVLEIAAPTAEATASEIERLTAATQSVLDNVAPKLDVAVSTRAAPADLPPAPDNASIADILTALNARLDAAVSSRVKPSDLPPAPDNASIADILMAVNARLDAAISTRAAPSDLPPPPDNATIGDILAAIDARLDAAVSTRSTLTAADVWSATTRTLTDSLGLTSAQATQLDAVFAVLGLDPARPVEITDTSRKAGAIDQTITDDGTTTTVQAS